MQIVPVKTPEVVKGLFPNFVWNIPTDKKEMFLTFDDGPTPNVTDWVLDTLESYEAKATFFVIGNNVEAHNDVYMRILQNGHAIGNHTYQHLNGWKSKTKVYIEDIELTEECLRISIERSSSKMEMLDPETLPSKLFRPPYGKLKYKQAKELQNFGYRVVMWDVLSFDWNAKVLPESCLENVISKATKGSIVVFHDSIKAEKNIRYALPKVLEYFSNKGFKFKAIF